MKRQIFTLTTATSILQSCTSFIIRPSYSDVNPSLSSLSAEKEYIQTSSDRSAKVDRLKDDLIALADKTRRGFSASRSEKNKMKEIVRELSLLSMTDEPAAAYYEEQNHESGSSLSGKWTLIYTDAPDITSLEGGLLSPAKLGKIGQECSPPYIKNVIEWKRPDWASSLPFSGGERDRVLQKVCCKGKADKNKPTTVDLKLVGIEFTGVGEKAGDVIDNSNGGPAALFRNFPVQLEGPLSLMFGKFHILYLDDDMRVTKTYQGFTTINIREEIDWF